jgi:hypothetical protein
MPVCLWLHVYLYYAYVHVNVCVSELVRENTWFVLNMADNVEQEV